MFRSTSNGDWATPIGSDPPPKLRLAPDVIVANDEGKADIDRHAAMSAYDPKQSSALDLQCCKTQPWANAVGCRPRSEGQLMKRRELITLFGGAAG